MALDPKQGAPVEGEIWTDASRPCCVFSDCDIGLVKKEKEEARISVLKVCLKPN